MVSYQLSRFVVFGKGDASDPVDFWYDVTEEEFESMRQIELDSGDFDEVEEVLPELYAKIMAAGEEESRDELGDDEDLDFYNYYVTFSNEDWPEE